MARGRAGSPQAGLVDRRQRFRGGVHGDIARRIHRGLRESVAPVRPIRVRICPLIDAAAKGDALLGRFAKRPAGRD